MHQRCRPSGLERLAQTSTGAPEVQHFGERFGREPRHEVTHILTSVLVVALSRHISATPHRSVMREGPVYSTAPVVSLPAARHSLHPRRPPSHSQYLPLGFGTSYALAWKRLFFDEK